MAKFDVEYIVSIEVPLGVEVNTAENARETAEAPGGLQADVLARLQKEFGDSAQIENVREVMRRG